MEVDRDIDLELAQNIRRLEIAAILNVDETIEGRLEARAHLARIVGLVGMHAEARVHAVLALGSRNDLTSAGDCRCNVDHLRDAGRTRALQHL